ncbi:MAG TPA: DHA2 family efflux MFS transporter permease subunit [Candidatus Baltobacteraceae bacterium]|nr:DHA2 family efflux MFS transporter permease subunit [Candidatus Baltobacteraceae bacterium]
MSPFRARANAPVALITITVMLGLIMAIIDATIVNVALNNIAGNLGASIDEVSWVATGYILASVIVMPLNGWLTAYFGRKNFYAGCLAIFTVASFLCGTAHSIWVLVFYRVLQGFGGGALQPTAQAILFETFPPAKRGAAMAIFGLGAMVGPAIGPTLGGYIIDNFNWPLIFYINIPIGIVAFIMTMMFIPNPHFLSKPKGGVDWIGLGLLSAGLASLQYVLERGQHDDWYTSGTIWVLSIVAAVSLVWFTWKTINDRHPLVDLNVFRFRTFTIGNIIGVIAGFGLFGTSLVLPLFFQSILGFTAFETGMALLPGAISTAISMVIVGRMVGKIDSRLLVGFGMLVFGASCWWLGGLNENADYWTVFWPRVLQGFGLGFLFVPLSTVTLGAVPREELAGATGVSTLLRQLGGSFGIAILTTLLARQEAVAQSNLAGGVTQTHGFTIGALYQLVATAASVISYDFLFRLCAIVFFVCAPLVVFMRPSRRAGNAPVAMAAE